jgi:broad specificity phosphatase PhoE
VLLTSDLSRARDTAQAVGDALGMPLLSDPRLRELHLGHWQGLTSDQARERFPDEHRAWRAGQDRPRGGGETYHEAGQRAAACLREHAPREGTLLAVTHGGTARAALGVLLELPPETWGRLAPLGNACWSVLVEGEIGWRLERHNVSGGPVTGGHDIGGRPAQGRDVEPVR